MFIVVTCDEEGTLVPLSKHLSFEDADVECTLLCIAKPWCFYDVRLEEGD